MEIITGTSFVKTTLLVSLLEKGLTRSRHKIHANVATLVNFETRWIYPYDFWPLCHRQKIISICISLYYFAITHIFKNRNAWKVNIKHWMLAFMYCSNFGLDRHSKNTTYLHFCHLGVGLILLYYYTEVWSTASVSLAYALSKKEQCQNGIVLFC